ncbi:MAG: hypothetical protein QG572_298 [Pseudomonadota bacterium]|nr:hypothetical protein [Pseudomonadota bacterium]
MQWLDYRRAVLVGLLSLGAALPVLAADGADVPEDGGETEKVVMVGNISYVSGGIGEESRERLKAFSAAFNLKLVLAMKTGEYIGDVQVAIAEKGSKGLGDKELVQAVAEGPVFMANLPAGSYVVTATAEGQTQRQVVTVSKGKLGTMHFRW